jgi:nucleoside-diphosphate-sugar epimerase
MYLQILGGSGFIGTHLCKLLYDSKINFKILDIKISSLFQKKFIKTDITNFKILKKNIKKNSILINLAAIHSDDISKKKDYYKVNVDGAKNICRVSEKKGIKKIIFTSSVSVYGFASKFCNENGKINPYNDYGKSKYLAEKVFKTWQSKEPHNRCLVIIRPTVVFGEGNRGNVYNLFKQIKSNLFFIIGNGNNIKSLAYVGNVVRFIKYSLKHSCGVHIYNYIDSPQLSINQMIRLIKIYLKKNKNTIKIPYFIGLLVGLIFDVISVLLNKKFTISLLRIRKFTANSSYSSSNTSNLNFKPKYNLKEALKRTINHEFIK